MKKVTRLVLSCCLGLTLLAGCASNQNASESSKESAATEKMETTTESKAIDNTVNLADDYQSLLSEVESHLTKATYHSDQYNLDIPYGVYVPESYDASKEYPLVMFIPDSSLVGKSVEDCLTQGYGGVVWADSGVQTGNPCLILIPAYPEMTVDDHRGYVTTDYVPATVGLIDEVKAKYSIDENRIYGTGQSMGCMMTMILASQNPDLFTACMFVDGQWDPSTLAPLAEQTFCYFAAHDDTSAYNGMQSEIPVWKENGASIVEASWNGEWDHAQLDDGAQKMLEDESDIYCIVWEAGTIQAKSMGGSHGGSSGGMSSVGVHMASFDYAYKCNTMVAWVLAQTK